MMTISRAEYDSLKSQNDQLSQQNEWLWEQLRLAQKKRFGASSEKVHEELMGQLSLTFNEAEAAPPGKKETTAVAAHMRAKRSSKLGGGLAGGSAC